MKKVILLSLMLISVVSFAQDSKKEIKQSAKEVGHATKKAGKAIGRESKKAGKKIGKETKKVVKSVKN